LSRASFFCAAAGVTRRRELLDLRPVGLEGDERLLVRRSLGECLPDDLQLGRREVEDLEVPAEAVAQRVELLVLAVLRYPDRLLGRRPPPPSGLLSPELRTLTPPSAAAARAGAAIARRSQDSRCMFVNSLRG
jgi:hypothetical protein